MAFMNVPYHMGLLSGNVVFLTSGAKCWIFVYSAGISERFGMDHWLFTLIF
jgi:hypothetical protein